MGCPLEAINTSVDNIEFKVDVLAKSMVETNEGAIHNGVDRNAL